MYRETVKKKLPNGELSRRGNSWKPVNRGERRREKEQAQASTEQKQTRTKLQTI